MLTPTIDTFGLAQSAMIYKSLESAKGRARIILADYFADFLEDAFGATDDAETLRSEERTAYQDALTDAEEEEATRRHPW